MENIVVLNEEQFEDIIYRTVSRCLNEKNIGNFGEKPEDEGIDSRQNITLSSNRTLFQALLCLLTLLVCNQDYAHSPQSGRNICTSL